jgi:hypothetical protein
VIDLNRDVMLIANDWYNQRSRSTIGKERDEPLPLPSTFTEFVKHIFWPHIEEMDENGPKPIAELNPMQLDFEKHSAGFRIRDGQMIGGRDVVVKSRRVQMSSYIYAKIIYAMLRFSGIRALTVYQLKDKAIIDTAMEQIEFALSRLPPEWVGPAPYSVASTFKLNGSRWDLSTAGHALKVARKLGRSGRIDILHLTETRDYAHPSAVAMAALKCVPQKSGWAISESTPSSDFDHWHTKQWELAHEGGTGLFDRAHFWPWYFHPLKRVSKESTAYKRVMTKDFEAAMEKLELASERELVKSGVLCREQVAFRRLERSTGTSEDRRDAKAENPETVAEAAVAPGDMWLSVDCVEACEGDTRDPYERKRLGPRLSVSYWVDAKDFRASGVGVFVGGDNAAFGGRDYKALTFRRADTLEQIAEIHGKALDSDGAQAIYDVLEALTGLHRRRYVLAIERNHAAGLLEHCERLGLRLYSETTNPLVAGKRVQKTRAGIVTSSASRIKFITALAEGVEGRDGKRGEGAVVFRSKYLVAEIRNLRNIDNKVQAGEGHDDLAMADAICLFVARKEAHRINRSAGISVGPRPKPRARPG